MLQQPAPDDLEPPSFQSLAQFKLKALKVRFRWLVVRLFGVERKPTKLIKKPRRTCSVRKYDRSTDDRTRLGYTVNFDAHAARDIPGAGQVPCRCIVGRRGTGTLSGCAPHGQIHRLGMLLVLHFHTEIQHKESNIHISYGSAELFAYLLLYLRQSQPLSDPRPDDLFLFIG